jgi:hypothetical protein
MSFLGLPTTLWPALIKMLSGLMSAWIIPHLVWRRCPTRGLGPRKFPQKPLPPVESLWNTLRFSKNIGEIVAENLHIMGLEVATTQLVTLITSWNSQQQGWILHIWREVKITKLWCLPCFQHHPIVWVPSHYRKFLEKRHVDRMICKWI